MFYSRHSHSARVTISANREWRLRAPDGPIRKVRRRYKRIVPGGVTGSEEQEGANGVGGGIGVGGGNGDGNGDGDGHGGGDGAGTGTGVEVNEGAQDGSGDGAGTGTGTGMGTRRRTPDGNGDGNGNGSEDCSGDGNGDDDNGNENRIVRAEGRRKSARNRKIVVDPVRETGETRVESEKNVGKKGLVQ